MSIKDKQNRFQAIDSFLRAHRDTPENQVNMLLGAVGLLARDPLVDPKPIIQALRECIGFVHAMRGECSFAFVSPIDVPGCAETKVIRYIDPDVIEGQIEDLRDDPERCRTEKRTVLVLTYKELP